MEYKISELASDKEKMEIMTEAVFANGKEKVEPLEGIFQKIKDELDKEIEDQDSREKKFDPNAFWKNTLWRDLENELSDIFGFRYANINPYIETYNSRTKIFQSNMLNVFVYTHDRFPIDGLVTDNGFYDKSHSIVMQVYMTLGMIKNFEPDELVACLLHEFGHGIDPALVDIKYTATDTLTKYMTDRGNEIKPKQRKLGFGESLYRCLLIFVSIFAFPLAYLMEYIRKRIQTTDKAIDKRIDKIKDEIKDDKDKFSRKSFSEAYADNFARMYGYGVQLAKALKRIDKDTEKHINSRYRKERDREAVIMDIVENSLADVHKTNIQRAGALIKEYKEDLKDPNIPAEVKKQIREDLKELELVLKSYETDFSGLQNRINKAIIKELGKGSEKAEDDKKE